MSDIDELQRRITTAMDRVAQGLDARVLHQRDGLGDGHSAAASHEEQHEPERVDTPHARDLAPARAFTHFGSTVIQFERVSTSR